MGLKSKKILGISVTIETKEDILEYIGKYLEKLSEKPMVIVTPNPEQIVEAKRDPHFAKILNQADVTLPDGIGLAFVIKQERVPGVEFMEDLVKLAAGRGYPIGLIGGRGNIAVEALECLQAKYPGLKGWAIEPEEKTIGEIGRKITNTKTRIIFVGLGAPKQEYFIEAISHQLSAIRRSEDGRLKTDDSCIMMSVGGSFDIISGRTPRAPHAIQAVHLEWLWRLFREPWRFRRQLALFKFLWLLASKG